MRWFLAIVLATSWGSSIWAAAAPDSSAGGLVVAPPLQQLIVPAQGDVTVPVLITNRTSTAQTLRLTVLDFKSLDESGGVAFLGASAGDLQRKYGLASWVKLPTDTITLPSGTGQKVPLTIANSAALSPGGHYGALIFQVLAPGQTGANRVGINQDIASLIFADKKGGEHFGLDINQVSMPKSWNSASPEVGLRFHNPGNVHVIPHGTVQLVDSHGRQVLKGNINIESGILLPEDYRVYEVNLLKLADVTTGTYHLVVNYRFDGGTAKDWQQTIRINNLVPLIGEIALALGVILLLVGALAIWRRRTTVKTK
jgi:hypothetical protein